MQFEPTRVDVIDCAKTYADGTRGLQSTTLAIEPGEVLALLGPSGCGKTTLLRLIAGLETPDAGSRILFGGEDVTALAIERRGIGMVFQHYALFPQMSVAANIGYGLRIRGVSADEQRRTVGELVDLVRLNGLENKRPAELSGGQRQRVALMRALMLDPPALLLDEPLGALDLKLREHMKIELKQLQAAFGTTFVYITHDQSEALVLSDQVAVMNAGRFEQLGTPQSLYYDPRTPFVAGFVGANNRIQGRAVDVAGDAVELVTEQGLYLFARAIGPVRAGDAVEAFVRPEVAQIARTAKQLPADQPSYTAQVESLLFDGANS
ncbi:ABC transporter ATP-binding protein, partial [Rhodoferax sp.]|uniref:ABC transporter ATP-binding protein n=1 Tax=Rhodoferax sp. TaxID=50421 RepID=UPI00374C9ED1